MAAFFAKLEEVFKNHWYAITLGILCFPFFCFMLGSLGFLVKITLTKWHGVVAMAMMVGVVAMAMMVGVVWYLSPTKKAFAGRLTAVLGILFACVFLSSFHVDDGFDSRSYHKPAAYLLADGWNPVWQEDLQEFMAERQIPWWNHLRLAHHFPKSQWIVVAITYLMTGNIDAGEYTNFVFIAAAFVVFFVAMRRWLRLRKPEAFVCASVMALHPFAISCLQNGCVDGILGNALGIFLFAGILWLKTGQRRWIPFLLISAVFGACIKFTGVPYFGIIGVIYSLPVLWAKYKQWRHADALPEKSVNVTCGRWFAVMFSIFFAVLLLGVHPYVTNTIHYSSPFYPAHSFDKQKYPEMDLLEECWRKPDFAAASPAQRFVYSYFLGQPSGYNWGKDNFTCQVSKLLYFPTSQIEGHINSFQWIFGLSFIVALTLLFFVRAGDHWLVLLALAASVLVQPQAWYVRFVPQLWLFPILVFAIMRAETAETPWLSRRVMWLCGILTLALFAQVTLQLYDRATATLANAQSDRMQDRIVAEHPDGVFLIGDMRDPDGFFDQLVLKQFSAFYYRRLFLDKGFDREVTADPQRAKNLFGHERFSHYSVVYCLPDTEFSPKKANEVCLVMHASKAKIPQSLWQTLQLSAWQLKKAWLG